MVVLTGGEAGVVEDHAGFSSAGLEFEVDDGIDAGVPMTGAPCLYDALVGDKFDVAADDETAKHGECAASHRVDGGRQAGEGGKLLLVEDGLTKTVGAGLEFDFVMDRGAVLIRGGGGFLLH